jgi:hypothetical protein
MISSGYACHLDLVVINFIWCDSVLKCINIVKVHSKIKKPPPVALGW